MVRWIRGNEKAMNSKIYVGFETVQENGDRMVEFPDCPGAIILQLDELSMEDAGIETFEDLVQIVFHSWYQTMNDAGLAINDPSSCLDTPEGCVKVHTVVV